MRHLPGRMMTRIPLRQQHDDHRPRVRAVPRDRDQPLVGRRELASEAVGALKKQGVGRDTRPLAHVMYESKGNALMFSSAPRLP